MQYPWLLQLVPWGQAPRGFPCESFAQSAGFDPSAGMHLRPSPGMVPGAGLGLAVLHNEFVQLPPT
jgi:hypothetical protein